MLWIVADWNVDMYDPGEESIGLGFGLLRPFSDVPELITN